MEVKLRNRGKPVREKYVIEESDSHDYRGEGFDYMTSYILHRLSNLRTCLQNGLVEFDAD